MCPPSTTGNVFGPLSFIGDYCSGEKLCHQHFSFSRTQNILSKQVGSSVLVLSVREQVEGRDCIPISANQQPAGKRALGHSALPQHDKEANPALPQPLGWEQTLLSVCLSIYLPVCPGASAGQGLPHGLQEDFCKAPTNFTYQQQPTAEKAKYQSLEATSLKGQREQMSMCYSANINIKSFASVARHSDCDFSFPTKRAQKQGTDGGNIS